MSNKNLFSRGYKGVREEKKRQDEVREAMKNRLWDFFIKESGEEADIRFLTEEPINFYEHTIKKYVNGKERYDSVTCSGDDCPHCADDNRPSFKGAFLVVDRRTYSYEKDGKKKTGTNQVKIYKQGTKVLSQLDRLSSKYGLTNRDITIVRLGKNTDTTYTFERGEEDELTTKEIENLLPETLREDYDGTEDSLLEMVENAIASNTQEARDSLSPKISDDDDDDDDDGESVRKSRSKIISVDDDDDDDMDEVAPKKGLKGAYKKQGVKKALKRR